MSVVHETPEEHLSEKMTPLPESPLKGEEEEEKKSEVAVAQSEKIVSEPKEPVISEFDLPPPTEPSAASEDAAVHDPAGAAARREVKRQQTE